MSFTPMAKHQRPWLRCRYDGALGIIVGIAAVKAFALEVRGQAACSCEGSMNETTCLIAVSANAQS